MSRSITLTVTCTSMLAFLVAVFDYRSISNPYFERVQHAGQGCPAGTMWHPTNRRCEPTK